MILWLEMYSRVIQHQRIIIVAFLTLFTGLQLFAQSDQATSIHDARAQASALARQGEVGEAVAILEDIYPFSIELGPSFAAGVARQLGGLWYGQGRFDDSAHWYKITLGHQAENPTASTGTTIDDAMRAAQSLERAGELLEAAEMMEVVGAIADQNDPADFDTYMVYQAWFQAASLYQQLGRENDVTRAYEQASRWISETDRVGSVEDIMVEVLRIEHGAEFHGDTGEKAEAIIALYNDPRFVDLPERLTLAGRYAAAVAYNAGRDDLLLPLASDIFIQAERFERQFDLDPYEYDIDLAYTQAAMHLAGSYAKSGEPMLAAETLEHALFAYPKAELAQGLKRSLFKYYDRLGIDPEQRQIHWDPDFRSTGSEIPLASNTSRPIDRTRSESDHGSVDIDAGIGAGVETGSAEESVVLRSLLLTFVTLGLILSTIFLWRSFRRG